MLLVREAGFSLLDTMILLSRRVTMPDDAMSGLPLGHLHNLFRRYVRGAVGRRPALDVQ
jgi:hypothetical protein